MNPIIINSANVVQFGFSSTFNLLTKKLILSLTGMTVFNTGGAGNITSIKFTVTDPTGMVLGPFTVNTGTLADIEVFIGNTFGFGYFTIDGILIDQDGKSYEVKVTPSEICEPAGWNGKEVIGKFEVTADCTSATAVISDKTPYNYKKLSPVSKVYDGKLFYPDNVLNEIPFEFTPFRVGGEDGLYSGTYRVKNLTLATYDLGDNVNVIVPYRTLSESTVDCSNSVKALLCCIDDIYSVAANNPNNTTGVAAKAKINEIAPDLMLAMIKDKNGKDASNEVKKIRKILNCDCGCKPGDLMEPSLIGGAGSNVTVVGSGASEVSVSIAGGSTEYEVHSKFVSVVKSNTADLAFNITKTENDNSVVYAISFNYDVLATTILNTIKGDDSLVQIFNEIVTNTTSSSIQGLDGSCVIDFECGYVLNESAAGRVVTSVLIGGTTYNAPAALAFSNASGIQAWLNGLGMGSFVVTYDGGTLKTTITSAVNVNIIYQLNVVVGGNTVILPFTRTCTTLKDVLQAIIDYLCEMDTEQVELSADITLCSIVDDEVVETVFEAGSPLQDYLEALATRICTFFNDYSPPTNGTNGTNGRSVQVFVQPSEPTGGTYFNGDIWIVE